MVSGALPKEQVVVKVEQANSKLWQGSVLKIEEKSMERATPVCAHYEQCGGCQQQHLLHQTQLDLKQQAIADQLQRSGMVVKQWALPLVSKPFEYRHRARFHVNKAGDIGFFEAKKKSVVAIRSCPVLRPELNKAFQLLRERAPLKGIIELEITIDDFGLIGLKVGHGAADAIKLLQEWAQLNDFEVTQPLIYKAGEHTVRASVGDFTQVNRDINRRMIEQVRQWLQLTQQDRLLDLFCGNGNFSVALADGVLSVIGVEGNQKAISNAIAAAEHVDNLAFAVHDLFTENAMNIPAITDSDSSVVILDPPRVGAESVCKVLATRKEIGKILYVSCDPATLARDLSYFGRSKWRLSKVGLIDMFPQTRHVETMALLERSK